MLFWIDFLSSSKISLFMFNVKFFWFNLFIVFLAFPFIIQIQRNMMNIFFTCSTLFNPLLLFELLIEYKNHLLLSCWECRVCGSVIFYGDGTKIAKELFFSISSLLNKISLPVSIATSLTLNLNHSLLLMLDMYSFITSLHLYTAHKK